VRERVFVHHARLDAPPEEVFRWLTRPGALARLTPGWEPVEFTSADRPLAPGKRVHLRIPLGPLRLHWVAEHQAGERPLSFRDVQVRGPFPLWEHVHEVQGLPDGRGSMLEDRVRLRLPFGALGDRLVWAHVERRLARLFAHRERVLAADLARHQELAGVPMKILVSGSSGLVGSALVPFLTTGGHQVERLVRGKPRDEREIAWDPSRGVADPARMEGFDAVVHLAGENIAAGRWTTERMRRIQGSRIQGTKTLCETLARVQRRPAVLVAASAVGFYGDRGNELLTETSASGVGFLAELCRAWEGATAPAADAGMRVVNLRIGVVLSARGGALARMLLPFRLGLGGRIGNGNQFMSWIALDDLVAAIQHTIRSLALAGPVNAVAPNPVSNREFTRVLAGVLHRPAIAPLPAFAARTLLGKMAEELLLASQRVVPDRLTAADFRFRWPDLEGALRHVLGRLK